MMKIFFIYIPKGFKVDGAKNRADHVSKLRNNIIRFNQDRYNWSDIKGESFLGIKIDPYDDGKITMLERALIDTIIQSLSLENEYK